MNKEKELEFVKKLFLDLPEKKQVDLSKLPKWKHAENTALYLEDMAKKTGEISDQDLKDLSLGALGHDLLEDTKVTEQEIKKRWGDKAFNYIQGMTKGRGGEEKIEGFDEYIERLKNKEPEEVLLIKYADIYANLTNSIKVCNDKNIKWINKFWHPVLKEYENNILGRKYLEDKFQKYPKTAKAMIRKIKEKIPTLEEKYKKINQEKTKYY